MQPETSDLNELSRKAALLDRLRRLQLELETEPDPRERNQILREMMELEEQLALEC